MSDVMNDSFQKLLLLFLANRQLLPLSASSMGKYNNKRTQAAAQALRNTPARSRFSKGPPNKNGRGGGRGRGRSNNDNGGRGGRGGNTSKTTTTTSRVIDKIQHRVDPQYSTTTSTSGTHQSNNNNVATTEQALKYLDKSKLDKITISLDTQNVISQLLQDFGILNAQVIKDSLDDDDVENDDQFVDEDDDDEAYYDDDDENDADAVLVEKSQARQIRSSIVENDYDEDEYEGNDVDTYRRWNDGELVDYVDDEADDDDENNDAVNLEEAANDVVDYTDNKVYKYLAQQLSFTADQAVRACAAMEGWEGMAAINKTSDDDEKKFKKGTSNEDTQLELALDWLCLHLTQEELQHGFTPNPNPPTKQSDTQKKGADLRIRAIPHPSISVLSTPIEVQAKEWAKSLKLQERTLKLVRLGFHHADAMKACNQIDFESTNNMSIHLSEQRMDPAIPILLSQLQQEALVNEEISEPRQHQETVEETLEQRLQELEALQAIYEDHLLIIHGNAGGIDESSNSVISDYYILTLTPSQPFEPPARTEDCQLFVFMQEGYPTTTIPLLMFVNPSFPPTLLRLINIQLHQRAYRELLGNPVVFETVSFLEEELPDMHTLFVKGQRKKEFDAEQTRLLRQRAKEVEESEQIMMLDDMASDSKSLSRRQRAKLKAAEKAYDRPDQLEHLNKEYRRKQDIRVQDAQQQNAQIRSLYAHEAIKRRQREIIEEEAERMARSAMTAALNQGETMEDARKASETVRNESLRENGITVEGNAEEVETGKHNGSKKDQ